MYVCGTLLSDHPFDSVLPLSTSKHTLNKKLLSTLTGCTIRIYSSHCIPASPDAIYQMIPMLNANAIIGPL